MKIGFISDTHHNLSNIDTAITLAQDVDLWLHAGDNIDDADYLATVSDVPVYAVCGNTDWPSQGPRETIVEIPQHKILLTHGDTYWVNRDLNSLIAKAKELNCDIIVFGHTHHGYLNKIDDIICINPGSVTQPRDGLAPSFMVANLNTTTGHLEFKRIFLNNY